MSPEKYVKRVEAVCDLVFQLWDSSVSRAHYQRVVGLRAYPTDQDAPYLHPRCCRPSNAEFWKVWFAELEGEDEDGDAIPPCALTGAAFSLPDIKPELQRALLMHNQCDTSWVVMRPILTFLLHIIVDDGIIIEPVYVVPDPLMHLLESGKRTAELHSIFHIKTAQGSFVLDLTGEQYGFAKDHRFLPKDEYMYHCVISEATCKIPWRALNGIEMEDTIEDFEDTFIFYDNCYWDVTKQHIQDEVEDWLPKIHSEDEDWPHILLSDDDKLELMKSFEDRMIRDDMSKWSKQWL